ncbi:MAG: ATP-binding cassette domain-containing protein [Frankia sp.]|nr:ATP-binding cassette domain-containing protein [Frankia sp.]
MSVLEVSDLSIRFGGLQALEGVTLQVNEWEIVGLIGPNGAGKTTAFNCITGFYKPDTGVVRYRGADVTRVPPHEKAALGFGRTFQNVGMVKSATALENLKTAQHAKIAYDAWGGLAGSGLSWREERELEVKAEAVLDLLGLSEIRNRLVGGLPYGTLKLLELGCALATDPDVLLLDEPSSGMGPEESDELGERLLRLRQEFGLTMLLIEHHVPLVLRVCDHVYVLNFGRLLAEGEPSVIQTHPEVVAAYLGGEAPDALAATEETAGKTTTVNAIAGVLPVWSGEIRFDGRNVAGMTAPQIVKHGIALSPEGRRVFPALSVLTNLKMGAWTRRGNRKEVDDSIQQVFEYFPRLEERKDQLAGTLSGGEQQMLAIGRALTSRPRLLLIDEASLGLSPKLAQTVFQVVSRINDDGTTVIIVEQNVGVLPYADQALIMEKGTLTFDGRGADLERSGDLRKTYLG